MLLLSSQSVRTLWINGLLHFTGFRCAGFSAHVEMDFPSHDPSFWIKNPSFHTLGGTKRFQVSGPSRGWKPDDENDGRSVYGSFGSWRFEVIEPEMVILHVPLGL